MTKNLIIFVSLIQNSKFGMWALRLAEESASKGKKTLFFEADRKDSVLHRFKKQGAKEDVIGVLKRDVTLNQAVQKTPAAPKLGIIWGNTAAQDISELSNSDMSALISDLTVMMSDYDCTVIKCGVFDFPHLIPCFTEYTKVVFLLSAEPDCVTDAIKMMKFANKAKYKPHIWLKIDDKKYPSQGLRLFLQIKDIFKESDISFFESDDNGINQKLLEEADTEQR